jgi:hypothetical protein
MKLSPLLLLTGLLPMVSLTHAQELLLHDDFTGPQADVNMRRPADQWLGVNWIATQPSLQLDGSGNVVSPEGGGLMSVALKDAPQNVGLLKIHVSMTPRGNSPGSAIAFGFVPESGLEERAPWVAVSSQGSGREGKIVLNSGPGNGGRRVAIDLPDSTQERRDLTMEYNLETARVRILEGEKEVYSGTIAFDGVDAQPIPRENLVRAVILFVDQSPADSESPGQVHDFRLESD